MVVLFYDYQTLKKISDLVDCISLVLVAYNQIIRHFNKNDKKNDQIILKHIANTICTQRFSNY